MNEVPLYSPRLGFIIVPEQILCGLVKWCTGDNLNGFRIFGQKVKAKIGP